MFFIEPIVYVGMDEKFTLDLQQNIAVAMFTKHTIEIKHILTNGSHQHVIITCTEPLFLRPFILGNRMLEFKVGTPFHSRPSCKITDIRLVNKFTKPRECIENEIPPDRNPLRPSYICFDTPYAAYYFNRMDLIAFRFWKFGGHKFLYQFNYNLGMELEIERELVKEEHRKLRISKLMPAHPWTHNKISMHDSKLYAGSAEKRRMSVKNITIKDRDCAATGDWALLIPFDGTEVHLDSHGMIPEHISVMKQQHKQSISLA